MTMAAPISIVTFLSSAAIFLMVGLWGLAHARWQHLCSQPELSVAAEVAGGGHIRIEGGQERLFAQTGMCQGAVCVARVASE